MLNKKCIGRGATAFIYEWKDDKVLKLFHPTVEKALVEREYNISSEVQKSLSNIPKAFELINIENQYGIIYEKVESTTLTEQIVKKPWLVKKQGRLMAELHYNMNKYEVSNLPSQKSKLKRTSVLSNSLSAEQKEYILNIIDSLPNDKKLCHGDFHPDNILMSSKGPIIIDWMTGTTGSPVADVARTALILKYSHIPKKMSFYKRFIVKYIRNTLLHSYLHHYFKLAQISEEEIKRWELPLAAERLIEYVPEEEKEQLLKLITKSINSRRD